MTTENPSSLTPPTLGDLVDVLKTSEGGEHMAQTLKKYTEGSFAGLFDQPTNVELNNQMIVFQIRDLEEQLRPIAMYVILNFLWNRIRADFKKRFLVIDEAWTLMQHEDSARFLYGLIKRARKYWLGVTTITQDVEDFVNSPYGKPIITNASLQILLKQSATAVDNLQKLFYLTDGEKYLLLNSDIGQGLFFAGNKHVAIQVVASPKEQAIITTKPEEVAARIIEQKEERHRAAAEAHVGTVPGTESAVTETPKPEQEIQNPAEASAQVPTESKGPDATPENPPESPTPPPST
jgi:type IV secretory pathway VirB4 component